MAVIWTEEPSGTMKLTASSVQDLIDELEGNPNALFQATTVECGNLQFNTITDVSSKYSRLDYCAGLLQGLKIAQELGVP